MLTEYQALCFAMEYTNRAIDMLEGLFSNCAIGILTLKDPRYVDEAHAELVKAAEALKDGQEALYVD